jgi:hypothetical protein
MPIECIYPLVMTVGINSDYFPNQSFYWIRAVFSSVETNFKILLFFLERAKFYFIGCLFDYFVICWNSSLV